MKSTIKLFLVVVLFSSVVLAEGNMGNGNRSCPNGTTCLISSEPAEQKEPAATESDNSVLSVVQEYLNSVFKYFEN